MDLLKNYAHANPLVVAFLHVLSLFLLLSGPYLESSTSFLREFVDTSILLFAVFGTLGWPYCLYCYLRMRSSNPYSAKRDVGIFSISYFMISLSIWWVYSTIETGVVPDLYAEGTADGLPGFFLLSIVASVFTFLVATSRYFLLVERGEAHTLQIFVIFLGLFYLPIGVFFLSKRLEWMKSGQLFKTG